MASASTATAIANTEVVLTIPALTSPQRRRVLFVGFSFNADPAAAKLLTIESPASTVIQRYYVTKGGPGALPMGGVPGANGQAVVIRLAADTGGAIGAVNAVYE